METLDILRTYFKKAAPTGSRWICDPPPMHTDEDWICLAETFETATNDLVAEDFEEEGEYREEGNNFLSFRKGDVNLIVVTEEGYYNEFCLATKLARKYNLLQKRDRIQLFQAILEGTDYLP